MKDQINPKNTRFDFFKNASIACPKPFIKCRYVRRCLQSIFNNLQQLRFGLPAQAEILRLTMPSGHRKMPVCALWSLGAGAAAGCRCQTCAAAGCCCCCCCCTVLQRDVNGRARCGALVLVLLEGRVSLQRGAARCSWQ